MVVLEKFYQVSEAQPKFVSRTWKILHIGIFAFTAFFSFTASFSFGTASKYFSYNCIIDSEIVFSTTETLPHEAKGKNISAIDLTSTIWGPIRNCHFVQFTPLVSMIASVVWGCFFIIIGKGGAGYPNDKLQFPWKIVYPCIIFCVIISLTFFTSTMILSIGTLNFCNKLNAQFENTTGCSSFVDYYTIQFYGSKENFYVPYKITEIGNYIAVSGWFCQLLLLLLRVCCITDYKIHLIRIIEEDKLFDTTYDEDSTSDSETFLVSEIPHDNDNPPTLTLT